jgi:hypothetical protein
LCVRGFFGPGKEGFDLFTFWPCLPAMKIYHNR